MFARLCIITVLVAALGSVANANNSVADDGQDVAATNIAAAKTYTVTNTGPDIYITAVAKDSSGNIVAWVTIGNGSKKDIGVPAGGSLVIDDRDYTGTQTEPTITNDTNTSNAGYTYT